MSEAGPVAKATHAIGNRETRSPTSYASRHDRRRLETRARLLRALMRLLSHKSLPDIAIHEIARVADVGGGTFYNHFTDRTSIHDAMLAELVSGWSDVVAAAAPLGDDAAETLASRLRLYITRAGEDRDWADFLVTTAFRDSVTASPIGLRLQDLIEAGRRQGRFSHSDPLLATRAICGLVVATVQAVAGASLEAANEGVKTTAFVLALLGVSEAECARLTSLALPSAPWDDATLVRRAHNARLALEEMAP